jgi:hypothetical protein
MKRTVGAAFARESSSYLLPSRFPCAEYVANEIEAFVEAVEHLFEDDATDEWIPSSRTDMICWGGPFGSDSLFVSAIAIGPD